MTSNPVVLMSISEWIDLASTVIQAIAIATTAAFAVAGLRAWRRELVGRRKFEIAEQTLSAFVEARDALAYVRSPLVYRGEGRSRPRDSGILDSEALESKRD